MSFLSKFKWMDTSLVPTLIATLFFIITLIIGSFNDLAFSQAIVNQESVFGKFFETFGHLIPFCIIPGVGVIFFKVFFPKEKVIFKVLGIAILAITLIGGTILAHHYIGPDKEWYGYRLHDPWGYIVGAIIMIAFALIFFLIIKSDNPELMIRTALVLLLGMVIQAILIEVIKKFNGRPRYRFLIDESLNTQGETFRNWWVFKPGTAIDDAHKSWPSGHSGTVVQTLLYPLLFPLLKKQNNIIKVVLYAFGPVYIFLMVFARILVGAHFLSDVYTGCILGIISLLIPWFLGHKLFRKKESTPVQQE